MDADPLDDLDAGILELVRTYDAAAAGPRRDMFARDRALEQQAPTAI